MNLDEELLPTMGLVWPGPSHSELTDIYNFISFSLSLFYLFPTPPATLLQKWSVFVSLPLTSMR